MEIIPGIHLIPGIKGVNCYLVIYQDTMFIVDTGLPGSGKKIIAYIESLGKNPDDVKQIIITHADIDHVGGASQLKIVMDARLVMHAADAAISKNTGFRPLKGFQGTILKPILGIMNFQRSDPDVLIEDNYGLDGFKVLHTPGHTPGSVCVYQPGRVIFVGDTLRSDSKGNILPPKRNIAENFSQVIESVKSIAKLEFDVMLTGHGAPVIGSASEKLKKFVDEMKFN
jgi:hydroxyacylglutathione hydrolase